MLQGQFKYFHFVIDRTQNMTLFLSNKHGYSEMYLNKGFNNLPNLKNYWLKGEGTDSQVLHLTSKHFQENSEMVDSFTLGIYGKYDSEFSVILVSSDHNLIQIEYQKILSVDLEHDKLYFFDYYNQHKKFDLMIYSDQSDVEIGILKYDPIFGQNFLDVIKEEGNLQNKFIFKKGGQPWMFQD